MSEKRFWFVIDKGKLEYVQDNVTGEKITVTELEDLLNEQEQKIQKLESENDDLRTTITKQVEAITEMKDIIYMLEEIYVIGEYSSEMEEDVQELKKAYDGTLEDFLNYFKDD